MLEHCKLDNHLVLWFLTVRKYKSTKDEGIGEKFSKISMHSTKKKLARLSQKMGGFSVSTL